MRFFTAFFVVAACALSACPGPEGDPGESDPCTVVDHGDGTGTMTCPDGTTLTVITPSGGHDAGVSQDAAAGQDASAATDAATGQDAAAGQDASAATDAATGQDAAAGQDASATTDAGAGSDAAAGQDASAATDAGAGSDAATGQDASAATDAATGQDAASGQDAAVDDASLQDAGLAPGPCHGFDPSKVVEGSCTINNTTDLRAFASTLCITGDLRVEAPGMTSLAGMEPLIKVGGNFEVLNNDVLTEMHLPALASVGGNFRTPANLASLSLPVLASVGGDFSVHTNAALTNLSLPMLASVGGNFSVSGSLNNLNLPALASVGGNFQLMQYNYIFPSLPVLVSVGGDFSVYSNAAMINLSLPMLASVGGNFSVSDTLTSLSLPVLTSVNSISLYLRPHMSGVGLSLVTSIDGDLTIRGEGDVDASTMLPALASVGGNFSVDGNTALTSLSLSALASVGGNFIVQSNAALPNCMALNLRDQVQAAQGIGGTISIGYNDDPCAPTDPCSSGTCSEDCSQAPDYYVCQ